MHTYTSAYILIQLNTHFTGHMGMESDWRPDHPCC